VVISDPETKKIFHPKHVANPISFKMIATSVTKWVRDLDEYALFPHWYVGSSFGSSRERDGDNDTNSDEEESSSNSNVRFEQGAEHGQI
jgi:hypothetical protein